ncbi:MAG: thioredoxin-disulfide reductase [Bacteroidales bacterium]|nr:thioredoxin-disulfide reductase [Bacteroidales bacterium]
MEHIRCLIIGAGPAGYTAGIYTGRADIHPVLYEGLTQGGQLTITTQVDNYPGFPHGESGPNIMGNIRQQAIKCGVEMRRGLIKSLDLSKRPFIAIDEKENALEADAIILATGAESRWLGLESEARFRGQGVSSCATCDGYFYKNMDVAVVGGGDTACEDSNYLAGMCRKVYLIVRRDVLRASKPMQHKVLNNPKIEVLWNTQTEEICGTDLDGVTGANLRNKITGETRHIDVAGFFVAVGNSPATAFLNGQLDLDEQGYIKVQSPSSHTSVEGVFACGDVCDPHYRQAIVAAGSGAKAGMDCERWLNQ